MQYVPNYEDKVQYIVNLINDKKNINRSIFNKILEVYNQNKENFSLEFYFEGSGFAIIKKKSIIK